MQMFAGLHKLALIGKFIVFACRDLAKLPEMSQGCG